MELFFFLFVVVLAIAFAVAVKGKPAASPPKMEFRALPHVAPPPPGMLHVIPPPPAGTNGAAGRRGGPKWGAPGPRAGAPGGNFVPETGVVQESEDALCFLTVMKVSDCTCSKHVAQRRKNL